MASKKSYLILLASQKGGVGKTTVAVNLATALKYKKYDVLLIDSDTATFSINEYLGIKNEENDYEKALTGEVEPRDAIFSYQPLGLNMILGSLKDVESTVTPERITKFYSQVMKMGYDFVILDCSPGLFNENIARYVDDVVIMTTPDSTAVKSSTKLAAYCEKFRIKHQLVINRAGANKFESETEEIEKMHGDVAAVVIPEDNIVPESMVKHKPAYMIDQHSDFSIAIEQLARIFTLRAGEPTTEQGPGTDREGKPGFFGRMGKWALGSK